MNDHVLQGHFLTRLEAARRAGVTPKIVSHRPDLLKLGGTWLEEVYFAFQFDRGGVRRDVGRVVQELRSRCDDVEIGYWLVRPNSHLGGATPLDYLDAHGKADHVIAAAASEGPEERPVAAPGGLQPPRPGVAAAPRRRRTPLRPGAVRHRHTAYGSR